MKLMAFALLASYPFANHTVIFSISLLLVWLGLALLHTGLYIGVMKQKFPYFAPTKMILTFGFLVPPVALLGLAISFGYTKHLSLRRYTDEERYDIFRNKYGALYKDFETFKREYPNEW